MYHKPRRGCKKRRKTKCGNTLEPTDQSAASTKVQFMIVATFFKLLEIQFFTGSFFAVPGSHLNTKASCNSIR